MLSIAAPSGGSGGAGYYLSLEEEEQEQEAEIKAQWVGDCAKAFGLSEVEPDEFRNLLFGFSPDKSEKLVQNAGSENRQPGWDLTFSAPKSVSVLYAMADEPDRQKLLSLHIDAVVEVVKHSEEYLLFTRRGSNGNSLEQARGAFALFHHTTSRACDPQLHTHCVMTNVGLRTDGSTGTIESFPFYQAKTFLGSEYRRILADLIEREMGLTTVPMKHGFHVEGVPRELCRDLSKRRIEIEKVLKEQGKENAVAARIAALTTRPAKEFVPRAVLLDRWEQAAIQREWGRDRAAELIAKGRSRIHELTVARERRERQGLGARPKPPPEQRDLPRWGRVVSRKDFFSHEFRMQYRRPFSKALAFTRLSELEVKIPRFVCKDPPRPPDPKWQGVMWHKPMGLLELRVQRRRLFENAKAGELLEKVTIPAGRIVSRNPWKRPEPSQPKTLKEVIEKASREAKVEQTRDR